MPTYIFQSGIGSSLSLSGEALVPVTLTYSVVGAVKRVVHRFDWTNAMIVGLGAVLTGELKVCALQPKTVLTNAYLVIGTSASGPTTLNASVGRTGALYTDYITASDAKAAPNTLYGDGPGERGSNLTGYDLPSYTGTTDVFLRFVATVQNLDQTTGSTGSVFLETFILP